MHISVNDMRGQEDDDFRLLHISIFSLKSFADKRNIPQDWDLGVIMDQFVRDQTSDDDGHAILNTDGGLDLGGVHDRDDSTIRSRKRFGFFIGNFRLDFQCNVTVIVDCRCHVQFDPGVDKIDAFRAGGRAAGRSGDRTGRVGNGGPYQNAGFLVINYRQVRVGQGPRLAECVKACKTTL